MGYEQEQIIPAVCPFWSQCISTQPHNEFEAGDVVVRRPAHGNGVNDEIPSAGTLQSNMNLDEHCKPYFNVRLAHKAFLSPMIWCEEPSFPQGVLGFHRQVLRGTRFRPLRSAHCHDSVDT